MGNAASKYPVNIEAQPLTEFEEKSVEWLNTEPLEIPKGFITIMAGNSDGGKTTILLDHLIRAKLNVLVASEDPTGQMFKPRVRNMGGDDAVKRFRMLRVKATKTKRMKLLDLSNDSQLEQLKRLLKHKQFKPDVVLLDPLLSYTGKVNDIGSKDVREVMNRLVKVAEQSNVAIIVVIHFSKAKDRNVLHMIAGNSQYGAASRVAYFATKLNPVTGESAVAMIKNNLKHKRMVTRKFNIIPNPKNVDFGLVQWGETMDGVDAEGLNRIVSMNANRVLTERDVAKSFLRGALMHGSRLRSSLVEMAEQDGLKDRTLERAASDLEIRKEKMRDKNKRVIDSAWTLPGYETELPSPMESKRQGMDEEKIVSILIKTLKNLGMLPLSDSPLSDRATRQQPRKVA